MYTQQLVSRMEPVVDAAPETLMFTLGIMNLRKQPNSNGMYMLSSAIPVHRVTLALHGVRLVHALLLQKILKILLCLVNFQGINVKCIELHQMNCTNRTNYNVENSYLGQGLQQSAGAGTVAQQFWLHGHPQFGCMNWMTLLFWQQSNPFSHPASFWFNSSRCASNAACSCCNASR